MVRRRWWPVFVLLTASVLAACQLIAGIDDDHFTVAQDASVPDSSMVMTDAMVDLCAHAYPPSPPDAGSGTGPSIGSFALYADVIGLDGKNDAGEVVGFDLDGVCTCFTGPTAHDAQPSCIAPPGNAPACDVVNGIDDQVGPLIVLSEANPNFASTVADQQLAIACGKRALLFTLDDYNGQADDEDVTLGTFLSWGILDRDASSPAPGPVAECGDAAPYQPAQGHRRDYWSHPASALDAGSTPEEPSAAKSAHGYVRNYELVVKLTNGQGLALAFGSQEVDLTSGVVTARLVPVDANGDALPASPDGGFLGDIAGFDMTDGVIGARVSADQMVKVIGSFITQPSTDGGISGLACNGDLALLENLVCQRRDVTILPTSDFQNQPCEALSLALPFHASSTNISDTVAEEPPVEVCPPINDVCAHVDAGDAGDQ